MKGLILKDFYTMTSTIKTYIFVIVLYVLAFGVMDSNPSAAVIASTIVVSMAPVTSIAYDEQSKWDKLARTTSATSAQIVTAKYLFSLLLSVAAALFSTLIIRIVDKYSFKYYSLPTTTLMAILLAVFYHSLLLPTVYKFGTVKGRIYTMLMVFIPAIRTGVLSFVSFWSAAVLIMLTEYSNLVGVVCVILLLLIYIGSIKLSVKIYSNKDL